MYEEIIGHSPAMEAMFHVLDRVVSSEATVLVTGENGTGKELVAKAIHTHSTRAQERFLALNCSALPDGMLESELFGHRRGAFTGAIADKPGLYELADRGTLFLDEIGDTSPSLQVRLLRVLQEGTFTAIGATAPSRADVRIIAATNKNLDELVATGRFRADLYYRLDVLGVRVPPLRERKEDVSALVEHFLQRSVRRARVRKKRLSQTCLDAFLRYDWPGNVRELENEIERLVVLSVDREVIEPEQLSPRILAGIMPPTPSPSAAGLHGALRALERALLHQALSKHRWNKTRASRELRISRRTLIRLVHKHDLERQRKVG